MALEGISRRSYPEPDRNRIQKRIAGAIETDPEPFFAWYLALRQSFEERCVCSDLFKGTLPENLCGYHASLRTSKRSIAVQIQASALATVFS